jgi:hypothetical protein
MTEKLKVGDKVIVVDVNFSRFTGEVLKVGRKLATIEYRGRTSEFYLETRRVNDNYGHQSYKTLEEVALEDREDAAYKVLKGAGLSRDNYHQKTPLDLLEALAETVKNYQPKA